MKSLFRTRPDRRNGQGNEQGNECRGVLGFPAFVAAHFPTFSSGGTKGLFADPLQRFDAQRAAFPFLADPRQRFGEQEAA